MPWVEIKWEMPINVQQQREQKRETIGDPQFIP